MKNINDLIPDFSSLELREVDYSMLGDLSKITLVSFAADPVTIAPFGRAMITWEVADDDSRCRLQLNGVTRGGRVANWDAAWIFVKYQIAGEEWQHARLSATGHTATAGGLLVAGLLTPSAPFDHHNNA